LLKDGLTPLHEASREGCVNVVNLLIMAGSNVDFVDEVL
jgi:ankyrin repeat protein